MERDLRDEVKRLALRWQPQGVSVARRKSNVRRPRVAEVYREQRSARRGDEGTLRQALSETPADPVYRVGQLLIDQVVGAGTSSVLDRFIFDSSRSLGINFSSKLCKDDLYALPTVEFIRQSRKVVRP